MNSSWDFPGGKPLRYGSDTMQWYDTTLPAQGGWFQSLVRETESMYHTKKITHATVKTEEPLDRS